MEDALDLRWLQSVATVLVEAVPEGHDWRESFKLQLSPRVLVHEAEAVSAARAVYKR